MSVGNFTTLWAQLSHIALHDVQQIFNNLFFYFCFPTLFIFHIYILIYVNVNQHTQLYTQLERYVTLRYVALRSRYVILSLSRLAVLRAIKSLAAVASTKTNASCTPAATGAAVAIISRPRSMNAIVLWASPACTANWNYWPRGCWHHPVILLLPWCSVSAHCYVSISPFLSLPLYIYMNAKATPVNMPGLKVK